MVDVEDLVDGVIVYCYVGVGVGSVVVLGYFG